MSNQPDQPGPAPGPHPEDREIAEELGELRPEQEGPPRKVQLIELLVFLALIVPTMAMSFFTQMNQDISFTLLAVGTIIRDLALMALIFYFVWRNGESWRSMGWDFGNAGREIFWGAVLFFPIAYGASLLESLLRQAGLSAPSAPLPVFLEIGGAGEIVLATLLVVVVAVTEETIFRGYMLLRLIPTTRSVWLAILLSGVIFSLGHGYAGTAGAVTVGAMGIVFALIYLWRKTLVAVMTIHFLQNFAGIVLLPLFGGQQ